MSRTERWVALVCFVVGLAVFAPLIAQQQFSGGSAVTITSAIPTGANTIGAVTQASGPWTNNVTQFGSSNVATGVGAGGAGIPRITVSNDSTLGLVAGTADVGSALPWTPCGTTSFETGSPVGVAAMPTSATAVAAATTCALTIIVSNTTAGALTYTVTDNAGSPINFLNAVTINAGERNEYTFPNGMKFNAGIKVTASGAGITYYINGLQ